MPASAPTPILAPGKPLALLTYLALSPGRSASREFLLDLLWADMDGDRGRHALRQTLWQLRQLLGESAFEGREEIHLALPVQTDRDAFLAAVEAGELETAVALYTGHFLPGFAAPGGVEFEQWADRERDRLRGLFIRAADTLARRQLGRGKPRDAVALARRIREAEPLAEGGWRLLLESLHAAQDRVQELVEADALEALLRLEGRDPEPATTTALRRARQKADPGADGTLPTIMAELVGREREFSTLTQAWGQARHGSVHVLLASAAGLGKTRLLQDFHARLKTLGARTVFVRANPGERDLPFALAADLAGALGELPGAAAVAPATAATLIALNPALSAHFGSVVTPVHGTDQVLQRTIAIAELISAVAYEAPIAILVDDLHWADPSSLRVLHAVRARLVDSRVLMVTTTRPHRDQVRETGDTTVLHLSPLTLAEVGALVGSIARTPIGPEGEFLITTLWRASGGSPLHVLEALQQVLDAGYLALTDTAWQIVDLNRLVDAVSRGESIAGRLRSLDRPASYLLTLLATAGAPCSTELLMHAAARESSGLTEALNRLERRGFITQVRGEWEPAHDEIAEAALEVAEPATRHAAAKAIAEALTAMGRCDELTLRRAIQLLVEANADDRIGPILLEQRPGAWKGQAREAQRAALAELTGLESHHSRLRPILEALPRRSRWWTAAFPAAVLALLALAALALSRPGAGSPDPVLLLVVENAQGRTGLRQAVIGPSQWSRDLPIATTPIRGAIPDTVQVRTFGQVRREGNGWELLHGPSVDNLRTHEVARTTKTGTTSLTDSPRDDLNPHASPDGRWIVFATSRWSPIGDDYMDIALMDRDGNRLRQLTRAEGSNDSPSWDPSGTRLAFVRKYRELRPAEVCTMTVEGRNTTCFQVPLGEPRSIVGWMNLTTLVVHIETPSTQFMTRLNLLTGESSRLWPGRSAMASLSPGGQWVACQCQAADGKPESWVVFPTSDPTETRTLDLPAGSVVRLAGWSIPADRRRALDTLTFVGLPDTIPSDASYRPLLEGRSAAGTPIQIPSEVIRWSTPDTTIAHVDATTGQISPRREGTITLHVSAGGWRSTSAPLKIRGVSYTVALEEDWQRIDSTRWQGYGEPRPYLNRGPGARRGMVPGGDGSFPSGAYLREDLPSISGVGLEAMVSTPVDRTIWQALHLALVHPSPSARGELSRWDHRSGAPPPGILDNQFACNVSYPAGEGLLAIGLVGFGGAGAAGKHPAPADLRSGRWWTVRMQVFPDGSCGVALDGKPVWRSPPSQARADSWRVWIGGSSRGTEPMVGRLVAWTGIRPDVNWSALDSLP